jgi:PAS domain S-box-containing protein
MAEHESEAEDVANGVDRLRTIVGISGCVYLAWWFMVEVLLPGSFNPLASRLAVVGSSAGLFAASRVNAWVARRLSALFTAWACLLVAHYAYLVHGNHGGSTWWVGCFVTFAAASMCLQSPREVEIFSVCSLGSVVIVAALEGQLRHSIYVPGLATILLLANITKRSQAIAERARVARRKSDLQRLELAAIVESSGDAIIASSLSGLIVRFNKGAERLFGFAEQELVGRPLTLLLPSGREAEEPALIARLSNGEAVTPFETVRCRRDGSWVDVSVTISPVRGARGELVGFSWAARDISEWKLAQLEAVRAREVAEAANRELEAFSYSIAHDLRAPLRGIDGFVRIVLEDFGETLAAEARDHLECVLKNADLMRRLIDGLLELGRVARANVRVQDVDLSELARASATQLQALDRERAVEFAIDEGLRVQGDGTLLRAVVDNLLGNAWKFTRNRADARIEFGATGSNGQTVYFVRDNGAGFDMTYASRLFGVFQRLHSQQEFDGTGVGLATVQRIVHRHGGRIWAEARVGEGASFQFTLSVAAAS